MKDRSSSKKTIKDAVKAINPQSDALLPPKISEETKKLVERRRALSRNTNTNLIERTELNKTIKKRIRQDKLRSKELVLKQVIDTNGSFKRAKKMLSEGTQTMTSLRDSNGVIRYGTEEILDRIKEFYSELYSGGPTPKFQARESESDRATLSVSEREIDYALNSLQNNKAAGLDETKPEMLKLGGRPFT